MVKLDIKIMAHKSRKDNVYELLKILNLDESHVCWDDRDGFNDAMYNARRTWMLPLDDNFTHRLVLQDDAILCDNFIDIVYEVICKNQNSVISLYHDKHYDNKGRYIKGNIGGGVGIIIPTTLIESFFEFVDNSIERFVEKNILSEILRHDTICMELWIGNKNIPCILTNPPLVQHKIYSSIVGNTKKRIAIDFVQNPPVEGW